MKNSSLRASLERSNTVASFPGLSPLFCITGLGAPLFALAPRPVIQKSGGKPGNEASNTV